MWLKDLEFKKEVQQYWMTIPPVHLLPKLQDVSVFMAKWGKTFVNKFCEKVKKQKETIGKLVNRVDEVGVRLYFEAVERLNDLLLQEEVYSCQVILVGRRGREY